MWNVIPQLTDFLCPQLENLHPRGTNVLRGSPLGFQNKLRRNAMLLIPLAMLTASIGTAVYMGFVWRPAEPKRVRLFFHDVHDVHGNVTA
jgi:hypothetical protein